MARQLKRLTARTVATTTKPGRHADGGNLYLTISRTDASVSKRWTFMYSIAGKQREAGFGPAANTRRGFRDPGPNRLQDRKNRRRVYRIDRLIENRPAIIIDRCAPLRRVYLGAPFTPLRFYEFIGALAERFARRRGLLAT